MVTYQAVMVLVNACSESVLNIFMEEASMWSAVRKFPVYHRIQKRLGSIFRSRKYDFRYPTGCSTMKHTNTTTTESNKKSNVDSITGQVELLVYLPSGQVTTMSVDYRTPMLDLLVKICTRNSLQLSEYTLQTIDPKTHKELHLSSYKYKPNTIVGLLGTDSIKVVPKVRNGSISKPSVTQTNKPFENTFRLKVFLPRNQLYVTRVSQNVCLYDVMNEVCDEKKLDISKYVFRHPANSEKTLDLNLKIGDYQLTEINLVNIDQISNKLEGSYSNNNRTANGRFNSVPRKLSYTNGDSDSLLQHQQRRCSSYTNLYNGILDAKFAMRKKRPAPIPPSKLDTTQETCEEATDYADDSLPRSSNGFPSCHSRNSSDSSGYHEASLLSECITPPPQKTNGTTKNEDNSLSRNDSQNSNGFHFSSMHSKSVPNLAVRSRKKKAAPPPPPLLKQSVSLEPQNNLVQ